MKKFFKFYNKKVILNSVEEAENWINNLHDHDNENERNIVVNNNMHCHLINIFADENEGMKMQTTGCSPNSFIYCYPALADRTEEHEKLWFAREAERKMKKKAEFEKRQVERKSAFAEREKELKSMPKGWYEVVISYLYSSHVTLRMHKDTKSFEGIAENGWEAYHKVLDQLKKKYNGFLHDWDDILEVDISFLGMRTDEGFSVKAWSEAKAKEVI
jgi:hypothetical protein